MIAGGGCEAIVNGDVASFQCDASFDGGVCPPGQYCLGSTCVPNGTGTVNCGDHTCAPGQVCAPKTSQCLDPSAACTTDSCHSPDVCDFGTRQCVQPAVKQIGDPCQADTECEGATFCAYASVLTTDVVTTNGLCTKPCCTSNDCSDAFVCYGAGTGGNYCVNKDVLHRQGLGKGAGGAACSVPADCRSGICDSTSKCADTCCSTSQCTNSTVCRALSLQGKGTAAKYVLGSGAPQGTTANGGSCEVIFAGECAEGVCDSTSTHCEQPCCSSNACSVYCDDTQAHGFPDTVTACTDTITTRGTKNLGEACTASSDCLGNRCIQDTPDGAKYCSDVCCTDADCSKGNSHLVCRPRDIGQGHFYLRCVHP